MIQPARLKPGVTLESLPGPDPERRGPQLPADSPEARSPRPSARIRGRALVFWDPSVPGKKRDAIDTDQITPADDCVSESLAQLDERWKAGAFRRNALNLGLQVVQSPEAVADAQDGDELIFDPDTRRLSNETRGRTYDPIPLTPKEDDIRRTGGIFAVGRREFRRSVEMQPSVDWPDESTARRMTTTEQILWAHRVDKTLRSEDLKPGATLRVFADLLPASDGYFPEQGLERLIVEKIEKDLAPIRLEIKNESGMHSVPRGSETHFKVLVVSSAFGGVGPVDRHRRVNDLLQEEFRTGLHALSLRALTPEEWEREPAPFESPPCLGGSKADASPKPPEGAR